MLNKKYAIILGSLTLVLLLAGTKMYNNGDVTLFKENYPENAQVLAQTESEAVDQIENIIFNERSKINNTYNRGGDLRQAPYRQAVSDVQTAAAASEGVIKLRVGDSGEEVKKLQGNLKKLGFFKEDASGFFGIVTKDAVVAFQVQLGIMPDGIVGTETFNKISFAAEKGIVAKEPVQAKTQAVRITSQSTSRSGSTVTNPASRQSTASMQVQPASQVQKAGSVKKGNVELLAWFGGAENVFGIGTTARVIDVDTGIAFNVQRTYGYNHADVEALTAVDTAALRKISGGFNWTRRAIIVEVNGRRLAASMTAMPHAGLDGKPANITVSGRSGGFGTGDNLDTIKGNGMDGHFDIHFYNSRTHGSDSVDSQHQAMVQKAYKSGN